MIRKIKIDFSKYWKSCVCVAIVTGFVSFLTPPLVQAETSTRWDANPRSLDSRVNEGFDLSRMWRAPGSGDASVFFTIYDWGNQKQQLWRSTKTGQRLVLTGDRAQIIAGVTKRYIYLHNSYLKGQKRIDIWRMNINGDPSTLRRIKSFANQNVCYDIELSRTTDDQFVTVINTQAFGYWEYGDGKICRSYDTRGVSVFRIGDGDETMVNIGRGLPYKPGQTTYVHSTGVGDIFGDNLLLFTAKHKYFQPRAFKAGLYRVALSNPRARGVFQFPSLENGTTYNIGRSDPEGNWRENHETELTHNSRGINTVKGATLLYSRVDAKVESGCELWRFNGSARGAIRLAQLNTNYGDDDCYAELEIAYGNRLIFKNINFQTNALEIWETRGSAASTKMLHSWTASQPGLLGAVENRTIRDAAHISLQVIGNRLWFVKRVGNGVSEVWRSSSLRSGATIRFQRMWSSQPGISHVRVLKADKTPLVLVAKSNTEATLYRLNQRTRKLVRLVSGTGMDSNIAVVDGEAIFVFRKAENNYERVLRAGLYSLNLRTGKLTTRKNFR